MDSQHRTQLRANIEQFFASGDWALAKAELHRLWQAERSSANASYVISCYERLRPHLNLTSCRIAIVRSFVLEPSVPFLRASALLAGIDPTVQLGAFDNYAQEMLNAGSELYSFQPDVVIFAVQTRDIAPTLWEGYTDASPEQHLERVAALIGSIDSWISSFRARTSANLILHTFEQPVYPAAGILDIQAANGQAAAVQQINAALQRIAQRHAGVYLLDYDGLVCRYGRQHWYDEQKWLSMRMPLAAASLPALAQEWLRFVHPLTGRIGKVLVTDLDNTLWGGIVGEDGIEGLQVGRDYPGAAYRALQRVLLDLHNRGILLAISSKNNEEEALDALNRHPGMLLRSSHFAAMRLNWNSKSEALRQIAEELNVGIDSLVFLDDNPAERQRVRADLPEVTVIDLPEQSSEYAAAVRECGALERITFSDEDRQRTRYYEEQRQRQDMQESVASLEDFYYSLEQHVEIAPVSKETLTRTAELIKKTNQFNLTTRRHSQARIAEFLADPNCDVYQVRVKDRFGDNGVVGVCITCRNDSVCEIDTLLLSCRVIGRTVETAILSHLVAECQRYGLGRLQGWFIPTPKNKVAGRLYPDHGFELKDQVETATLWSLNVRSAAVACPPWIVLNDSKQEAVGA